MLSQLDCSDLPRPKTSRDCPNDTVNYICVTIPGTFGQLMDIKYDSLCEEYKCCRNTSALEENSLSTLTPYDQITIIQGQSTDLSRNEEMSSVPVMETTKHQSSCNSFYSNFNIPLFLFFAFTRIVMLLILELKGNVTGDR